MKSSCFLLRSLAPRRALTPGGQPVRLGERARTVTHKIVIASLTFAAAVTLGSTRSVAQTGERPSAGSDLRLDVSSDGARVTVHARGVGRLTLLHVLADRTPFKLRVSGDMVDEPIDCDLVDQPIVRVIDELLRDGHLGYVMSQGDRLHGSPSVLTVASGRAAALESHTTAPDAGHRDENVADVTSAVDQSTEAPAFDPVVIERYTRDLSGPSVDDMLATVDRTRDSSPGTPFSTRRPERSGFPSPVLSAPAPSAAVVAAPAPRRIAVPPASPWVPVTAADVNGIQRRP